MIVFSTQALISIKTYLLDLSERSCYKLPVMSVHHRITCIEHVLTSLNSYLEMTYI